MATPLNRGLATVVANPGRSFTDYAVDTERRKRARKDQAISEARQLLISKQAFSPYAGAVNDFINSAVDEIAQSDDLDPRAYTQAVEQYMEYYNYSKQVEGFLKEASASYQKDKEVNEQVAAKAIMDRYVKDRSLDELATLAGQPMDAEDVVLKTPGALKADVVIEERLKRFGDIILEYTERAKKGQSVGGGNMMLEGENIAKKYKQYIKKDGDNIYVDPQALQDKGFFDVLMSDARVKAIAERELEKEGITAPSGMAPVEEKKAYNQQVRDKLANIMNPFVDYTETRKDASRFMTNWYARRSSRGSDKKDDSAYFNNWYRDFLSGVGKASTYAEGAKIPITGFIADNVMFPELLGDESSVILQSVERVNSNGKDMVKVTIRPGTKGSFTGTSESAKGKSTWFTVPVSEFMDSELAASIYQEAKSAKGHNYEESTGVGAGVQQPAKTAADILNKFK